MPLEDGDSDFEIIFFKHFFDIHILGNSGVTGQMQMPRDFIGDRSLLTQVMA